METGVVKNVGKHTESAPPGAAGSPSGLEVQTLGRLTISRDGEVLPLPSSRKVRALIAYLSVAPPAPHVVARSQLCELLWDIPNDPRGELRWCLSKARGVVDEAVRQRVVTAGDAVWLDLADCIVDAIEVNRAIQNGIATLSAKRLRALAALFRGDFLEGLEISHNVAFNSWLTAQRRRFRGYHIALIEQLAAGAEGQEEFDFLEKWLELAPFDPRVHERLLQAFARHGQIREGEDHLEAMARQFDDEGLDSREIRRAWQVAKAQRGIAAATVPTQDRAGPTANISTNATAENVSAEPRRASIAVMPFAEYPPSPQLHGGLARGLVYDVITRLATLRSLFVIAQGSVFELGERQVGAEEAGRMLNVDYVVSGAMRNQGNRFALTVELTEARSARIVWAEVFDQPLDDTFQVLDEIVNRVVASIAAEVEMHERNRAILKPPSSLDAWEAHHCGLWHMYRFSKADNDRAQQYFGTAVRLDPTFARAYAGLSFTHFQNAFQGWAAREPELERALNAAGQSLMVDDRDPAAHCAMGRALWLQGRQDQSVTELEQAIHLSPSFALGHYALAFVHSQSGDPEAAVKYSDHSRQLSPYDPLLFGMLGSSAMALVRLRQFDEAAEWAVKAAARPNAHTHILAIAAYSLALAGRLAESRGYMARILQKMPGYRVDEFLTAMQFESEGSALFREGAKRIASM